MGVVVIRGSARMGAALVAMAMLFHCGAAGISVPNWNGSFDKDALNTWFKNTAFEAGYYLYFEHGYDHNVVKITNPEYYTNCNTSAPNPREQTYGDEFKLELGPNLFICPTGNFCETLGMKLNITI